MAGILQDKYVNEVCPENKYKQTSKILIIGPSGSGKTTLAINLCFYTIEHFGAIHIITPLDSQTDEKFIFLANLCKDANIQIQFNTAEEVGNNKTPILTNKSGTVVIIDDYYTSTGRDPNLEHLLKHLINTGRHSGIHIIYCAHLATRLPNEIKTNNNGIYISGSFMNNESVFKGLGYPMPEKENIIGYTDSIENEKKAWYLFDPMLTDTEGNIHQLG